MLKHYHIFNMETWLSKNPKPVANWYNMWSLSVKLVFQQQNSWHTQVGDVRSQLRFLEAIETLQKKKRDEEERERVLRFARVGEARIKLLVTFLSRFEMLLKNSTMINVFRLNVSLLRIFCLCIKSWITCLVVITESLTRWRSRVSAAQAKSQRGVCVFPSLKSLQESFLGLRLRNILQPAPVYVSVCEHSVY